jgi:ribulose-phosphate 3-epimerase
MKRVISPSLLSANFAKLTSEIQRVEQCGVNRLHLDVMDAHFVPNLTFGPFIIDAIRKITECHLETHLMIENPHKYLDDYINAGSDTVIIHFEASHDPISDLKHIRSRGVKAGIAINPDTSADKIEPYLQYLNYILIMSVFPGFGGQSFIESTLDTMKTCAKFKENYNLIIGVDGGVNLSTIRQVYETGIDVTIVGSALYGANDVSKRYKELMHV